MITRERRVRRTLKEWAEGVILGVMLRLGEAGRVDGILVGTVGAGRLGGQLGATKAIEALGILAKYAPHFFSMIRREVRGVIVVDLGGRGEMGRWKQGSGVCLLDVRHTTDDAPELIAATIVHEATHGRLLRAGIGYGELIRRRVEMVCVRRMIRFAENLPPGDGRAAILAACGEIMELPWSYWCDEKKALEVAGRGGWGWKRTLALEESRAGRRRGGEAGHGRGFDMDTWVNEGLLGGGEDGPWEASSCAVRVANKCGHHLKIVWGGWMVMTDGGEWREVVTQSEGGGGWHNLGVDGDWELEDEFVPLDGVFRGAMWACVGVDPEGRTYYGESILDRQAVPRNWREWCGGGGGESGHRGVGGGWQAGLDISHQAVSHEQIMAIEGARGLVGRIAREYGEDLILPYETEVINRSGEDVRILWMQSYSQQPGGGWSGSNIMGRALGPADFARWFGGEGVSEDGWIANGDAARCDLGWLRGRGGRVMWVYRAIGRSGKMYEGKAEIILDRPLSISALLGRRDGGV